MTIGVELHDLEKIVEAADQIEALIKVLPGDSSLVALLKPIDSILGEALYGPTELASAISRLAKEAREEVQNDVNAATV